MSTARSFVTKELNTAYVREIFGNLESGDGKGFFDHVADNVDWIVEGTHPLAGHYHTKPAFSGGHLRKAREGVAAGGGASHRACVGEWGLGGSRTAFPCHRKEWVQVRQPVLLGMSICEWHDRRGPSVSRLHPRCSPFRGEPDLEGIVSAAAWARVVIKADTGSEGRSTLFGKPESPREWKRIEAMGCEVSTRGKTQMSAHDERIQKDLRIGAPAQDAPHGTPKAIITG